MTITNQTNPVGSQYISDKSQIIVPKEGVTGLESFTKERIYTSVRLTKSTNNPPTYTKEIVQHPNATSDSYTVIAKQNDSGEYEFNLGTDYKNTDEVAFRKLLVNQTKNQIKNAETKIKKKINSDSNSLSISQEMLDKGITEESFNNGLSSKPVDELKELQNRKGGIGRGGKNTYGALFYPSFIEKSNQDKLKISILEFAPKKKRTRLGSIEKKSYVPVAGTPIGNKYDFANSLNTSMGFKAMQYQEVTTRTTGQKEVFKDQFSFNSRKRMEFGKRTLGHITLPIPDGVSDANKVNFGDGNLNPVQALLADDVTAALMGEETTGVKFQDELQSTFEGANKFSKEVKEAIGGFFSAKTLGMDKDELISRTQGRIFNNNLELLFKGPTLRTFNFRYKMSPRDETEIKQVMKIIKAFKQSSAVQKSKSGIFLVTPNTYKLEFKKGGRGLGNKNHMFLPKIKECALMQVAVDYMPEGSYMTYENEDPSLEGSMVTYIITLSFQELEPLFNDDYFTLEGVGF